MPETRVVVYCEESGKSPFLDWLTELQKRNLAAAKKCVSLIVLLKQLGYELQRPRAATLRDGVYELRTKVRNVNYRILYGFVGENIALLSHGITKEGKVPAKEIDLAAERLRAFEKEPAKHAVSVEEIL